MNAGHWFQKTRGGRLLLCLSTVWLSAVTLMLVCKLLRENTQLLLLQITHRAQPHSVSRVIIIFCSCQSVHPFIPLSFSNYSATQSNRSWGYTSEHGRNGPCLWRAYIPVTDAQRNRRSFMCLTHVQREASDLTLPPSSMNDYTKRLSSSVEFWGFTNQVQTYVGCSEEWLAERGWPWAPLLLLIRIIPFLRHKWTVF